MQALRPKVSVVIPAFNAGGFIKQTVKSVFEQTYPNLECIVVNDGSTDNTREEILPFVDRITYLETSNLGRAVARNRGIGLSSGVYIAFLDADDYWDPSKLEEQVAYLESHPSVGALGCGAYLVDRGGGLVRELPAAPSAVLPEGADGIVSLLNQEYWIAYPLSTLLIRMKCIEQISPFDESINTMEEWSLLLRLVERWDVACIMKPLAYYRSYGLYTPQKVAPRHRQDKLVNVVQSTLDIYGHLPQVQHASDTAFAYAYLRGALLDCAIGEYISACSRLESAAKCAPELFVGPDSPFILHTAYFATSLYDDITPLSESKRFVRAWLSCFPPNVERFFDNPSTLMKQIYLNWLFDCYRRSDFQMLRSEIWKLIISEPRLLRHPGVLGILLESIVGSQSVRRLRGIKRRVSKAEILNLASKIQRA